MTERMPCCGRRLKNHEEVGGGGKQPRPGDVSVCANCCTVLWFDEQCRLRLPMSAEIAALTDDELILLASVQEQVHAGGLAS